MPGLVSKFIWNDQRYRGKASLNKKKNNFSCITLSIFFKLQSNSNQNCMAKI